MPQIKCAFSIYNNFSYQTILIKKVRPTHACSPGDLADSKLSSLLVTASTNNNSVYYIVILGFNSKNSSSS